MFKICQGKFIGLKVDAPLNLWLHKSNFLPNMKLSKPSTFDPVNYKHLDLDSLLPWTIYFQNG